MTADRGPWLQTRHGGTWYPLDPRADEVDERDVASALARICRFGGHVVGRPYSVAEHSVRVADLVESWGGSPAEQLEALVHDAHEAYPPGDVPSPVKRCGAIGAALVKLEDAAARAVRRAFGVAFELGSATMHADLVLLATERRDLMAPCAGELLNLPAPLPEVIHPWRYDQAEATWLLRLRALRRIVGTA